MGLSDGAGMARGKTEMGGMNGNASLGIGAAKLALSHQISDREPDLEPELR